MLVLFESAAGYAIFKPDKASRVVKLKHFEKFEDMTEALAAATAATKHDTPKYGLIYHAQLVGQSTQKLKGKMSRMLAAKAALATRVDALGDDGTGTELGIEHRAKLETRLRVLEEGGGNRRISGTARGKARQDRYEHKSFVRQYEPAEDSTLPTTSGAGAKRKFKQEEEEGGEQEADDVPEPKPKKKKQVATAEEVKTETVAPKKKKVKKEPEESDTPAQVKTEPATPKKKRKR
ncbi:hypothetical protein HPB52_013870 [Rhipicephalus sanguineus]|uniref:Nop domain-containing protein n=1 Tax=Rhipicephalus sanguineus TaxID=34632 RepID=A0A9D4YQ19_RHISA|nr:hypothetical protein HPB52_013870 [Rhipicephalus sanguineus]